MELLKRLFVRPTAKVLDVLCDDRTTLIMMGIAFSINFPGAVHGKPEAIGWLLLSVVLGWLSWRDLGKAQREALA